MSNVKTKNVLSFGICALVLFCYLLFGICHFTYAAPCYGTKLPLAKEAFWGVQAHTIFDRDLEDDAGSIRSAQYFLLLSYGVLDWFSIDLKGGAGNIKQHPIGSDEIDYNSNFAGGYGFRLKVYDKEKLKMVFGFQHISVHPKSTHLGMVKHKAILDDWQYSLLISKDIFKCTPYLGARWSRIDYIHWIENDRKRVMSDLTKGIGLIVGCDLPIAERVWFNIEGQFLDSEALAFSLNCNF